jgi:hypothetical protein
LSTIHSQRPPASPAITERSNSPSDPLVGTSQRLTDCRPIRTRAVGGHSPMSPPGSSYRLPAQRAPSPVPASSATTSTSTGPSSSLVPDVQVRVARTFPDASRTVAKSVTVHPGLIGQGR